MHTIFCRAILKGFGFLTNLAVHALREMWPYSDFFWLEYVIIRTRKTLNANTFYALAVKYFLAKEFDQHKEFLWFLKWDPSSFPKEKVNWNQNETEMRLTPRNGIDIKSMFFLDCTNFYFSGCHFPDHFSIFS